MGKEEGPEALQSGEGDPQGGLWRPGPCLSTAEANGLPGIHHDRDNTCPDLESWVLSRSFPGLCAHCHVDWELLHMELQQPGGQG